MSNRNYFTSTQSKHYFEEPGKADNEFKKEMQESAKDAASGSYAQATRSRIASNSRIYSNERVQAGSGFGQSNYKGKKARPKSKYSKKDYRSHYFNSAKSSAMATGRLAYGVGKTTINEANKAANAATQGQIGQKDHMDSSDNIKQAGNTVKNTGSRLSREVNRLNNRKAKKTVKAQKKSNKLSRKLQKKAFRRRQYGKIAKGARTALRLKAKKAAMVIFAKAKMAAVGMLGGLSGIVIIAVIMILVLLIPVLFLGIWATTGGPIAAAAVEIALVDRVTTRGTRSFPNMSWWNSQEAATYREVIEEHGITPPFASCDRGAGAAIRWSVDPSFPFASSQTQREYMQNVRHFDFIGIWTEIGSAVMEPGDVLVTNHDRDAGDPGHIMIYVGNEAVQSRFPNSPSNVYDASLSGERLPAVVYHVPHIFRAAISERIDVRTGEVIQEARPVILYYVFRFNGDID